MKNFVLYLFVLAQTAQANTYPKGKVFGEILIEKVPQLATRLGYGNCKPEKPPGIDEIAKVTQEIEEYRKCSRQGAYTVVGIAKDEKRGWFVKSLGITFPPGTKNSISYIEAVKTIDLLKELTFSELKAKCQRDKDIDSSLPHRYSCEAKGTKWQILVPNAERWKRPGPTLVDFTLLISPEDD